MAPTPPSGHWHDSSHIRSYNRAIRFFSHNFFVALSCIPSAPNTYPKMGGKKGGAGENSKKAAGNARVCVDPAPAMLATREAVQTDK